MFTMRFRLKLKTWLLLIRFTQFLVRISKVAPFSAYWLKRFVEIRAAKSVGLIGGGAMLVDRQGQILSRYLQTIDGSTVFGPN